ncbi:MAG: hypothetical protein MSC31_18835 [Solirubrobacteraceae bacterium MAG38_C4-C5]|nr:hypothetical protein [Candidatus Siliceabacter maunaloa]
MRFHDLANAALGDGMSLVVIERDRNELDDSEIKVSGEASTYLQGPRRRGPRTRNGSPPSTPRASREL